MRIRAIKYQATLAVLVLTYHFGCGGVASAGEVMGKTRDMEVDLPLPSQAEQPTWLDKSQHYVATSSDALAGWIDHFFGAPRADLESAYSTLRLTLENNWKEQESSSSNIRLRGKVRLPRVNKRLSLVFTDEDTDELTSDGNLPALDENNSNTDAALQYNVRKKGHSRLDLKLGLRSSGKLKASARYRYEVPWSDKMVNRFTETLYFVDGEGFGSYSGVELDRLIDDSRLVRWSNSARFEENSDGVEWSSRVSFAERLNRRSAVTYFTWVSGETRPDYLTTSYGIGTRFRRNFYRSWLFYELEPAYAWQRPEITDGRDSVWLFTVRLEMLFERD